MDECLYIGSILFYLFFSLVFVLFQRIEKLFLTFKLFDNKILWMDFT